MLIRVVFTCVIKGKGKVDRPGMFLLPEKGKDFEVEITAFADGGPTKTLRTLNGRINPIAADVALLYSPTKLPVKVFPKPARAHHHQMIRSLELFRRSLRSSLIMAT